MSTNNYARSWENLRVRESFLRVLSFIFDLAYIGPIVFATAFFGAIYYLVDALGIHSLNLQIFATVVITAAIFAALGWCRLSFRCPRCSKLFFVREWSLPLKVGDGKECVHCQLARDSSEAITQ